MDTNNAEYYEEELTSQQTDEGQNTPAAHRIGTLPKTKQTPTSRATASRGATQSPEVNVNNTRGKIPPMHVSNTPLKQLISMLQSKMEKNEFMVKQTRENTAVVYTFKLDSFVKAKTCLADNKVQFFTYTPKPLKNKNLVLKGIHGDYTDSEILIELKSLNLDNVNISKVSKITFNKSNPNASHFLVQLTHDSNTNILISMKSLLYQKIRWEPLRKKEIFQCRKCQRLGHSSVNCYFNYRCVKCNINHEPGKCLIAKDSAEKKDLYCVNCKKHGHPASYRGCPFITYSDAIKKEIRFHKQHKNDNRINTINENVAYSNNKTVNNNSPLYSHVLASNNHPINNNPPNLISILENFKSEIIQSFSFQMQSLHSKIEQNSSRISKLYTIFDING